MGVPFVAGTDYAGTLTDVSLIGCASYNNTDFAFVLLKLTDDQGNETVQLSGAAAIGGVWLNAWDNLGQPSVGIDFEKTYQGTVATSGPGLLVYVCGGDGHLWNRSWNGTTWLDWVRCDAIGPVVPLQAVDHASVNFIFIVDDNGQAWAMAPDGLLWVADEQAPLVIAASKNMPLAFLMGGQFYCALTVAMSGLMPKLFDNAGITTNKYVAVSIENILGTDMRWHGLTLGTGNNTDDIPMVCVAGWLPSAPGTIINTSWYGVNDNGDVLIDLSQLAGAEDGMLCWVMVKGGRADSISNFKMNNDTYPITADSSAANFNYCPNMPNSPQGGDIGYVMSVKGSVSSCWWSFSSCCNIVVPPPQDNPFND